MTSASAALLLAAAPAWAADVAEIKQRGALRVLGVLDTREPEFFSLKSEARAPALEAGLDAVVGELSDALRSGKVTGAAWWLGGAMPGTAS